MTLKAKPIDRKQAMELISRKQKVHVFISDDDGHHEAFWPRDKVERRVTNFGAELAGEQMQKASHGVASVGDRDTVFFLNRFEGEE